MPPVRLPLVVPELGAGPFPITLVLWLVRRGTTVQAGDRLAELSLGAATVVISAPSAGLLSETTASEDDVVAEGQVIGYLLPLPDDEP